MTVLSSMRELAPQYFAGVLAGTVGALGGGTVRGTVCVPLNGGLQDLRGQPSADLPRTASTSVNFKAPKIYKFTPYLRYPSCFAIYPVFPFNRKQSVRLQDLVELD